MDLYGQTIVCVGDSITDMNRGRNPDDLNHIYGHSYVFLLAAHLLSEHPQDNIRVYNRGNSGDQSFDLTARWETDILALRPDIITVLVGTNDILCPPPEAVSADTYRRNLDTMYCMTRQKLPDAVWIVCEPFAFPLLTVPGTREKYERFLPKFQAESAAFAHSIGAVFPPLQSVFDAAVRQTPQHPEHWIWDGVHPTAAGHQLIAQAWLAQVAAYQR